MAFYRPLQRKDGRWDYTCTNDAGTFAIGYCYNGTKPFYALAWDELSDVVKSLYGTPERWEQVKAEHAPRLGNYHNDGHESPEEAVACHKRYEVLEHARRFEDERVQQKCLICEGWTQHRVVVGTAIPSDYPLCVSCDNDDNVLAVHSARRKG